MSDGTLLHNVNVPAAERAIRDLLVAIGQDPDREGLRDTPRRVAKWWQEFIDYHPGEVGTCFEDATAGFVMVSGMRVWSLCEHHLLPFWCDVTVAYLPTSKVLGLSKFARVAHKHAHRPQLQERLISGVADEIKTLTSSHGVVAVGHGEHLCMTARGIRTPSIMTSLAVRGEFPADLRAEVLAQARSLSRGVTG